jgi:nitrite reductase/ring-hydroxylating ferredoxin subunit
MLVCLVKPGRMMTAQALQIQFNPEARGCMAEFKTVCRVGDIPDGQGKTVTVGGKLIAVFNTGGQYHAIDDTCPHMGASLGDGYVEDGIVTCPWHAWRFRLSDGVWADTRKSMLSCYAVRIVGNEVQVEVPQAPQGTTK